jgi:hypothetical protein
MLALDKAVGSTRINRYEQQLSLSLRHKERQGYDNLDVPVSFMFDDDDARADNFGVRAVARDGTRKIAEESTR